MISMLLIEVLFAVFAGTLYVLIFPGRRGKNFPPGMVFTQPSKRRGDIMIDILDARSPDFTTDWKSPSAAHHWRSLQVSG